MILEAGEVENSQVDTNPTSSSALLADAQQIFTCLSEDLYCKQLAVQQVLDSCHDGIIDKGASENTASGKQPHEIAKQASTQWKSKSSNAKEDRDLMNRFLSIK